MRPGRLWLEYAPGRRRPYVNPFRLLLIAVVAYKLMSSVGRNATLNFGPETLSIAPAPILRNLSVETTIDIIDPYGLLRHQVAAKKTALASGAARERFHHQLAASRQPLSFANVVFLAAVLHLCFRWKRRRFLEHTAFSMHVISFVVLSSVTLMLALYFRFGLGRYMFLVILLISFSQFAYIAIAIRRFYLQSGRWSGRLLSVAAAMLIYLLNSVFMKWISNSSAVIEAIRSIWCRMPRVIADW